MSSRGRGLQRGYQETDRGGGRVQGMAGGNRFVDGEGGGLDARLSLRRYSAHRRGCIMRARLLTPLLWSSFLQAAFGSGIGDDPMLPARVCGGLLAPPFPSFRRPGFLDPFREGRPERFCGRYLLTRVYFGKRIGGRGARGRDARWMLLCCTGFTFVQSFYYAKIS